MERLAEYVRPSAVEAPAQGVLYNARRSKAQAWKRVKELRRRVKDEPLGGDRAGLRLQLLHTEDAHREALRAERNALTAIEARANELGQTTRLKPI